MLPIMTIGFSTIASPYIKSGIEYVAGGAHTFMNENVPAYNTASRNIEWICSNPACSECLVDQSPVSSVLGHTIGNILGANCKNCKSSLHFSHNVTPIVKYQCIAALCLADTNGSSYQKVLNMYMIRSRNDANKSFDLADHNTIVESVLIICSYLKRYFK